MRNKKETIKLWSIIILMNVAVWLAFYLTQSREIQLIGRIAIISFFVWMLYKAHKIIKSFEPMIRDGFTQHIFEPKYLYTLLIMSITGFVVFAVFDYLYLPTWWMWPYILGTVIIPFSTKMIPLRKNDNRWK